MILTNGFEPDVRVYKEAKYLVKKGCSVTILCWDRDCNNELAENEIIDGIEIRRFRIRSTYGTGYKQIFAYIRFLKECRSYLNHNKFDYIHCHDIDGAIIGAIIKGKNHSMIFDMHEVYEHGNYIACYIWRHLTISLLKKSKYGIYVTNFYLQPSYEKVSYKLRELRNYPDSTIISALPKTESEFFRIGYHGVVRDQIKDFKALFEAIQTIKNVRVDINGGGNDLAQLKELESHYNNVYVHGPFNGISESSKLYSETDLLFCAYSPLDPNYQGDTEVIKFYEAIFTGTPILVSRGIGMETKVTQRGFGVSCNTQDKNEIHDVLEYLIANKDKMNQYRDNELSAANDYSWERAVQILDEVYELV